jgi:transcription elongation factor GreA
LINILLFCNKKYIIFDRKESRRDGIFSIYINDEIMSAVSYYTAEGLKKLREELDYLKHVARPKASQDIADARDKGDLSENAEYDAAKEAQGLLEMRIAKLEEIHANARLIDESQLDVSKALVLSNVKIRNQANGLEMKYTLVAESEADLKSGKISVTSPIGRGLLGKSVGDIAEINVPNGTLKFEVLEISRD